MIKKLAASIRQYKKDSVMTPVLVMFEVLMEVMIPFIMAYLIDYGIDAGDMPMVLKLGLLLIVMALVSLFFGVWAGKTSATAAAGFARNLRKDMFYNVQGFSFANIDKFSTSSIITRLTTDVTNVQNSFQMILRMAARSPIMLVFSLAAAFRINGRLSLIFLAAMPVLGIGLWFIMRGAHPIFKRVFKIYDKLNNVVQENLHGVRVVKSYIREEHEKEKFFNTSKMIYDDFSKAEKLLAFNMPLVQFCMYGSMLLLSWFGARAVVASGNNPLVGLSTGQLMSLFTYTMQILMSLMMLSMVFVMITISRASAERIVEVLDEDSDLKNPADPLETVTDGSIDFQNVDFTYTKDADKLVLKNIDLHIPSGATVGILGGTGSSKTSLISLIPRLYDVNSGSVKVGGEDVRSYDIKSLRDQVAVVLQKNQLFSGTIKDNIRWGNENATDEEIEEVCKLAQADEFIQGFENGYDTYIEQGGSNVSGGQKQRLCIARALLKRPKILILDDSTSAVDTKTDSQIRRAMRHSLPDTTKLIIAQRVASVEDADMIIVMDDGTIQAVGTHQELLEGNEIYKEVYESQVKGGSLHE
ncbi:ABC transporter ATP-binding protein [Alkalibacter rhizosphaerae]|uniref:ABC transporter ATP-binding protein n=1 Tax=Alkalibacter rhizosphaerae TaxID=2815577 RepID=A0A974XD42_9FIRM|nr:ABC transporter ATP-binding protein [Alkalibacter rhizosphaerae]QSX07632.1 ABC transporter ATP-binding protein [Alkalibacter rhizosphaerae]